jgi:RimJ/RimL family protein N-acetyltransferase
MIESNCVKLKNVKKEDLELIMAWRSNSKVYKNFHIQQTPLKWEEHIKYWNNGKFNELLFSKNKIFWIILYNWNNEWRKVGVVGFSELNSDYPNIVIYIGEVTLWKKGIGSTAVSKALKSLMKKNYKGVYARVSKTNQKGIKMFERLGFIKIKNLDERWLYKFDFGGV